MKPIEKPEWLRRYENAPEYAQNLITRLIDNQNELIAYARSHHHSANGEKIDWQGAGFYEQAREPGHWETRPGHPVGWIPDKPEPEHWECPVHGEQPFVPQLCPITGCGHYLSQNPGYTTPFTSDGNKEPGKPKEPGHWECEDCNHVYSKTDSGAAFMPRKNDGKEYNCIFCDPGGGTVHWIPDKPKEDGYYWCATCGEEIPRVDVWDIRTDMQRHYTQPEARNHKVTGPHKDLCPECGADMVCELIDTEWFMACGGKHSCFSYVEKPTKAEAIHAWRKVFR